MEFEKIITLINTVSASTLTQFSMEEEAIKISMKKEKQVVTQVIQNQSEAMTIRTPISGELELEEESSLPSRPSGNIVKSPLVGTFYNAASPEVEVFVKAGDTVKKGQTLGIVEAMKLMNEIESEFDGVIEEILVENEAVVEYGQPLFVIK